MSHMVESSIKNFVPLEDPFPGGFGGPKSNFFRANMNLCWKFHQNRYQYIIFYNNYKTKYELKH